MLKHQLLFISNNNFAKTVSVWRKKYGAFPIVVLCFSIYFSNFEVKVSKAGDRSRGWSEGSLFNSYYTDV